MRVCVPPVHYNPAHFGFLGTDGLCGSACWMRLSQAGLADFWACLPYYSKRSFLVAVLKFYCWSAQNIDSLFGSLVCH